MVECPSMINTCTELGCLPSVIGGWLLQNECRSPSIHKFSISTSTIYLAMPCQQTQNYIMPRRQQPACPGISPSWPDTILILVVLHVYTQCCYSHSSPLKVHDCWCQERHDGGEADHWVILLKVYFLRMLLELLSIFSLLFLVLLHILATP